MSLPDTIQARLHPDALKRVTRMFTATTPDVLSELFQNARRAGATRVTVQVDDLGRESYVRIADDGSGIADPRVLLSFGENGWAKDTVQREDAAGMGFAALSQFDSTVVSQVAGQPAWQVHLTPAHFAGDKAARVFRPVKATTNGHGTRVSFRCRVPAGAVLQQVGAAARHFPLPVDLTLDRQNGPEAQLVKQAGFLDDCPYHTRLAGIDVGVRTVSHITWQDPNINFFGHTVHTRLPSVQSLDRRTWVPYLDVKDCADLQLTLPARRDVIENDFYRDLQDRLVTVLYEAVAASDSPCVSHTDHADAHKRGVDLPVPPARLETWRPRAASGATWHHPASEVKALPDGAFLVDGYDTPADDLTIRHALHKAGLLDRAFSPDSRLRNYAWYDVLPHLADREIFMDGKRLDDIDYPQMLRDSRLEMPRPDRLEIRLTFHRPHEPACTVTTDLDYALVGEPWEWLTCNSAWFLTTGCELDVEQLVNLLECAFFDAAEDVDADTLETQQIYFRREARETACELLLGSDAALQAKVHTVLRQSLPELFFKGQDLTIRIQDEAFSLQQKPAATEPAAQPA